MSHEPYAKVVEPQISPHKPRHTEVSEHVDIIRIDWLTDRSWLVDRVPVDSPRLVHPDGTPTQLAQGWASYFHASEPHTMADCPYEGQCRDKARTERDHWIKLFNRLEAAITHHARAKADLFVDEADEALYAARAKILSDAARGPSSEVGGAKHDEGCLRRRADHLFLCTCGMEQENADDPS